MKKPSNISHPLKNYTGTSQRTRIIQALDTDAAPIDGKTLADRLYLISDYARHINFYDHGMDQSSGEYQELDNWSWFFKNSLPFQLAILSKTSLEDLQAQFLLLSTELKKNPSRQSLESVLVFILNKFIEPTSKLYKTVEKEKNSFTVPLLGIIKSSFVEPIKKFIPLHNASAVFLCTSKERFSKYMELPWQLEVEVVYDLDLCIKKVKKGKKEAYLIAANLLEIIFYQLLIGMQDVVVAAPYYIPESLLPLEESLQKKHQPHLALLFTFLELFKHLQDNSNELGKKHLDFFYKEVLKIIPKEAVPDKAHIVFEIAKHLEEYPLPKNLLLKDAKDINKQEIQFGLDHELILDKAEVKEVRTLTINGIKTGNEEYIEGVYVAPIANTVDGIGKAFEKDTPNNWPTLGSKYSKHLMEGNAKPEEHPSARLGFALASPVLLLQEGKRTITILLNCNLESGTDLTVSMIKNSLDDLTEQQEYVLTENIVNECASDLSNSTKGYLLALLNKKKSYPISSLKDFLYTSDPVSCLPVFNINEQEILCKCLTERNLGISESLLKIAFSGEKAWVVPKPGKMEKLKIHLPPFPELNTKGDIQFEVDVILEEDDPMVTFYNAEKLKEKISLDNPSPVIKIELNPKARIKKNQFECDHLKSLLPEEHVKCCLIKKGESGEETEISIYHYLSGLTLVDAKIDVEVCGARKLIVQNDEGVLDINSQLFPFGLRPEVPGFDPIDQATLVPKEDEEEPSKETDPMLGPSFYIGSKEILYKKWHSIRVNLEWKEKPESFHDHYKAYLKKSTPPNGSKNEADFGLDETKFLLKIDELENGSWSNIDEEKKLFSKTTKDFENLECGEDKITTYGWEFKNKNLIRFVDYSQPLEHFKNSQNGFLKFTLKNQDFLHKEYPFVLGRQMLAYSMVNEGKKLMDAIYFDESRKTIIQMVKDIINADLQNLDTFLLELLTAINGIQAEINLLYQHIAGEDGVLISAIEAVEDKVETIKDVLTSTTDDIPTKFGNILSVMTEFLPPAPPIDMDATSSDTEDFFNNLLSLIGQSANDALKGLVTDLESKFNAFKGALDISNLFKFLKGESFQALIPNEPWTPIIKNLYIDYSATAIKEDIDIIHLYPFETTTRREDIENNPTLLPYFEDEGTLFIGIDKLSPGGNVSLLFQLAEATADSEMNRARIHWQYLSSNNWKELRTDFNVISDGTDGLTVSGIVTIAIPDDINTIGNTLMPDNLYWLKVFVKENAKAVAETIGIHTQAAKASARLSEVNDKSRLETAMEAGKISKLVNGDFSIKKVQQPYTSFEGRKPEAEGHFYTRVSEHLRHRGRALMGNDYEKIVLEGFPSIYKVKCITHTMGLSANLYRRDLEIAPGYVVLTVIPDLTKLKAGNLLEPRVPVSLLEKIGDHIRKRTSPFARIKVMNPRFEYVDVSIEVRLYRGKSKNFYSQKLKEDITSFLAPWSLGDSEKLAFGQVVLFSDVVGFVEQLDYVDFIADLQLTGECEQTGAIIKPLTARSILAGGKICVEIEDEECLPKTKCVEPNIIDESPIIQ